MRTNVYTATVTVLVLVGLTMVTANVVGAQAPSSERERRAPSGFLGMRGKKSEGMGTGMMSDEDYPAGYDPIAARIAAAMSMPLRVFPGALCPKWKEFKMGYGGGVFGTHPVGDPGGRERVK
ncbi:hypothetical protein SK128_018304, partial [Halocaridina rubra]